MENQKISKEQRRELLEKLLKTEMERLRKICFKYKRRQFLHNPIIIEEKKMEGEESNVLGFWTREDVKNQYRFTHKITLNQCLLDRYLRFNHHKRYLKKQVISTLQHELIHALCYEEYEEWVSSSEVTGTHKDGSPIFLANLWFLTRNTHGHNCGNKFKRSKIYKQIKDFTTWDQVRVYCINLMFAYNKSTKDITDKYNKQEYLDAKHVRMISNYFSFSPRGFGLTGTNCSKIKAINLKDNKKLTNITSFWEIGAYILPLDLEKLFEKKISNYSFASVEEKKFLAKQDYMIDVKTKEKIAYQKPAS
jgi:hypothetical protein